MSRPTHSISFPVTHGLPKRSQVCGLRSGTPEVRPNKTGIRLEPPRPWGRLPRPSLYPVSTRHTSEVDETDERRGGVRGPGGPTVLGESLEDRLTKNRQTVRRVVRNSTF